MRNYFHELARSFGDGWNRFWFTPRDVLPLCVLRIVAGVIGLAWLGSHTADLVRWFGPHGLLPLETVRELTAAGTRLGAGRLSLLQWSESPAVLWTIHAAGFVALAAFTVGLCPRISNLLSLMIVLSYVHRAPLITGQLEPVLTMTLAYLCLTPAGASLSVDAWLRRRRSRAGGLRNAPAHDSAEPPVATVGAAVGLRLVQVHLAALYLLTGLSMLAGRPWWNGEAIWWLIARTESRWLDLSGLHRAPYLINVWTHLVVLVMLLFGVLVWHRLARPLLLVASVAAWLSLAAVTGLVGYCSLMAASGVVFIPAETLRQWGSAWRSQPKRADRNFTEETP